MKEGEKMIKLVDLGKLGEMAKPIEQKIGGWLGCHCICRNN